MKQFFPIVIVMLLWAMCFPLILGRPQSRDLNTWLILTAIGLGATTTWFYGMFRASEFLSPGIATVITNTQPLMAAILATLVLKERIDRYGKTGLWPGFWGILLIAYPCYMSTANDIYGLGISYIFLIAVGISISNVLISKLAGRVDALSAMGWQLIIGSVFLGRSQSIQTDILRDYN